MVGSIGGYLGRKAMGLTTLPSDQVEAFLKAYDEQVAEGLAAKPLKVPDDASRRRIKQHPATNLLVRFRDFRASIWRFRFLIDWRIPFTNNRTERMVRSIKAGWGLGTRGRAALTTLPEIVLPQGYGKAFKAAYSFSNLFGMSLLDDVSVHGESEVSW
ncbi:MAG: hypothetical protein ABR558_04630 [Thioalkalivibrio sp.]